VKERLEHSELLCGMYEGLVRACGSGPDKHTAVQVFGCRECLSLALLPEDKRDSSCVGCNQVNDLLSLVTELKEEVKMLRSIRECEREIHW